MNLAAGTVDIDLKLDLRALSLQGPWAWCGWLHFGVELAYVQHQVVLMGAAFGAVQSAARKIVSESGPRSVPPLFERSAPECEGQDA